MPIHLYYGDREKTKTFSTNDYTSLSDYNYSFRTANQVSQLRMVIAPGTEKYWNSDAFNRTELKETQRHPIVSTNNNDCCDYSSYPKKQ
jgi:hypothetical protein